MKLATTILVVIAVIALAVVGVLKLADGATAVGIASILVSIANGLFLLG